MPKITYDAAGTPGVWAAGAAEAYAGLGFLHGFHRPVQSLLLGAAGRGVLAEHLACRALLADLDLLVHRLDIPRRGGVEAERLTDPAAAWLDAYLIGFDAGLREGGRPFELRLLLADLPPLDRASILSSLMLSTYLGTAQGQERMERALVDALAAGADPTLLASMFDPHLEGWEPGRLAALPRSPTPGMAAYHLVGGSNAWAVTGSRATGGRPILCGDPHLQVNQLPSLFFEVRARVGDDFWLGATIPGLPGLAIGRNRRVAWSSTFSVPDTIDFTIERLEGDNLQRGDGRVVERQVEVRRRLGPPIRVSFWATEHGVLEAAGAGETLAVRWAGAARAAETLAAHMELPLADCAERAEKILERAVGFSLHWVVADVGGTVLYKQTGRIPRRNAGWSGLYPVPADGEARWLGFYEGATLPGAPAEAGVVVTANEPRPGADGATLSTLAQPPYRRDRILELLGERQRHNVESMQAIQLDLTSGQARRLLPRLVERLDKGPVRRALGGWDARYDVDSRGAHAFDLLYRAALSALASDLGGDWLTEKLAASELGIWWCAGFDRLLADPQTWAGERGTRLRAAFHRIAEKVPEPWGAVQQVEMKHMIFGGLPRLFGLDRGPFPLPGSIGTVRQGYVVSVDGAPLAIAPAYRFIADLADADGMWTSMAGGIDGSRFSATYTSWLDEWREGRYHRIAVPRADES